MSYLPRMARSVYPHSSTFYVFDQNYSGWSTPELLGAINSYCAVEFPKVRPKLA